MKHAGATEIAVTLRADEDRLVVEVSDDGRGLPAEVDPNGNGLTNLRERMDAVGGSLSVESAPGLGTRIAFTTQLRA